jgi:ATP-dependent RNA helicase DDX56/DBP9
MSFDTLGLDPKLVRAMHKREFRAPTPVQVNVCPPPPPSFSPSFDVLPSLFLIVTNPTLSIHSFIIQAECIPKALEGKDIVATARTGSGKTLAYLLPALHRILSSTTNDDQHQEVNKAGWQALILVPTRELCEQVREECSTLASTCGITVTALSNEGSLRHGVTSAGNVVVATPARIAAALKEKALTQHMLQRTLRTLVLDEADLLLSYGYEEDVAKLAPVIPRSCQCMLMSATSSGDIDTLSKLILHSPVSLDLLGLSNINNNNNNNTYEGGQEEDGRGGGGVVGASAAEIEHHRVDLPFVRDHAEESSERLLHVLAMLRLGLVHRKVLIFVNSADIGMKVKLFLDAFGIKAAVIHAELPLNSRHHILQQFNKGLFDYLIATDDVHGMNEDSGDVHNNKNHNNKAKGRGNSNKSGGANKKRQQQDKEEEFGVTRGIDFKGVNTVINYQLPSSVAGYIHRVGRTGRAGHLGTAITLFHSPKSPDYDDEFVADLEQHLMQASGENQETGSEATTTTFLKPFTKLTKATVDALRYRSEDVARSVTGAAIKEARAAEIKAELLNSKRLKAFFEERPSDLNLLRHDRALTSASAAAPHLKHLPAYLREAGGGSEILKRQGRGILPAKKRRKLQASGGAGVDPVKGGGGGFTPAPKKGGADRYEPMTAMEKRAAERKDKKKSGSGNKKVNEEGFVPKRNVRKHSGRKR